MGTAERLVWFERAVHPELRAEVAGEVTMLGPGTADDLYDGIDEAHAILASVGYYDGSVMDRAPHLKVIARTGIGYDRVDVPAATDRWIAVCNAPDAPTVSTAEHAMALMLAAAKSLQGSAAALRAGEPYAYEDHRAVELAGRTLGLVGFGRIARRVAAAAAALDMLVIAYDPYLPDEAFTVDRAASFEGLLAAADVVSVHVPLTEATTNMFDAGAFAQMRQGALFINSARGGLVDQNALLGALDSGRIFAAGLDVTDPEPLPRDHPLLHHDRVIVTSHVATATSAARLRIFRAALRQITLALSGTRPDHIVNPEVWDQIESQTWIAG